MRPRFQDAPMPYFVLMPEGRIESVLHYFDHADKNKCNRIVVPFDLAEQTVRRDSVPIRISKPHTGPDMLHHNDWLYKTYLQMPFYDVDSEDDEVRETAANKLRRDLLICRNLIDPYGLIFKLRSGNNTTLSKLLTGYTYSRIIIQVPMFAETTEDTSAESATNDEDTWIWWNDLRDLCTDGRIVRPLLELIPGKVPSIASVRRWLSELLEGVIFPTSLYANVPDYGLLLKMGWPKIFTYFAMQRTNVFFRAKLGESVRPYAKHLEKTVEDLAEDDSFGFAYGTPDEITVPPQPIRRRFSSRTYKELHSDDMKYLMYASALRDYFMNLAKGWIPYTQPVIVTVLGAGVGSLIRSVLTAAYNNVRRPLRIYAVEKDDEAVNMLRSNFSKYQSDDLRFHFICADVRDHEPKEKADIVIWELLGPFGDDGLAPDCLYFIQKYVKERGFVLPYNVSTYINPIMAPTFQDIINGYVPNNGSRIDSVFLSVLHKSIDICPPQCLWSIDYPSDELPLQHPIIKTLEFTACIDSVMNGLVGSFEAMLHPTASLSTHYLDRTPEVKTWYPVFFPFTYAIKVKKGDQIVVVFERHKDDDKVWYEWRCIKPQKTQTHNGRGDASRIYLN